MDSKTAAKPHIGRVTSSYGFPRSTHHCTAGTLDVLQPHAGLHLKDHSRCRHVHRSYHIPEAGRFRRLDSHARQLTTGITSRQYNCRADQAHMEHHERCAAKTKGQASCTCKNQKELRGHGGLGSGGVHSDKVTSTWAGDMFLGASASGLHSTSCLCRVLTHLLQYDYMTCLAITKQLSEFRSLAHARRDGTQYADRCDCLGFTAARCE